MTRTRPSKRMTNITKNHTCRLKRENLTLGLAASAEENGDVYNQRQEKEIKRRKLT